MEGIRIHTIIAKKRKEKGITQQQLADYLGVSKPAVSKWEAGKCFPDITLLPLIASFFDITIDELIGYKPQLTKDEINRLYQELCEAFATRPFEEVYNECQTYIKNYYSCWPFLLSMGVLFLNHVSLAADLNRQQQILQEAIDLFQRIIDEADDPRLLEQAETLMAASFFYLKEPEKTIELLEGKVELPLSRDLLLVKAYVSLGDINKAKSLIQGHIYSNLMDMLFALPDCLQLYADDEEKMEIYYSIAVKLFDIFKVREMHPASLLQIYFSFAQVFAQKGDDEKAIELIEKYAEIVTMPNLFPIELKGNEIFDQLDSWFDTLDIARHSPRSSKIIKRDLKNVIINNPLFTSFSQDQRFQHILWKLEQI